MATLHLPTQSCCGKPLLAGNASGPAVIVVVTGGGKIHLNHKNGSEIP